MPGPLMRQPGSPTMAPDMLACFFFLFSRTCFHGHHLKVLPSGGTGPRCWSPQSPSFLRDATRDGLWTTLDGRRHGRLGGARPRWRPRTLLHRGGRGRRGCTKSPGHVDGIKGEDVWRVGRDRGRARLHRPQTTQQLGSAFRFARAARGGQGPTLLYTCSGTCTPDLPDPRNGGKGPSA